MPVSVIVPTYNGEEYVDEALRSVFDQTALPTEIVVVDDASTDDTVRRVEHTVRRAPVPVRLIRLPSNSGGPVRPINVGIEAAESPLIAVLDQDDVLLPSRIESQASILQKNAHVAFVFGFYVSKAASPSGTGTTYDSDGRDFEDRARRITNLFDRQQGFATCNGLLALRALIRRNNFVGGFPGFTFRRDHWEQVGGLNERLSLAADYDLLCSLCRMGDVAVIPEVQYVHRVHAENLSRRRLRLYTDLIEILSKNVTEESWPNASREIRRAIANPTYQLAVAFGMSSRWRQAVQFLAISLALGGVQPRNLVRVVDFPLKVARRKLRPRTAQPQIVELEQAAHSLETLGGLFRPVETPHQIAGQVTPLSTQHTRPANHMRTGAA